MPKSFISLVAVACMLMASAWANTIDSIVANKSTAEPNETIEFKVVVKKTNDTAWCGGIIELGDGREQLIRFGANPGDLEQTFKFSFPKPGNYSVMFRGRTMIRGLNSLIACDGYKTVAVLVQEKKPEVLASVAPKLVVTAKIHQKILPPIDQNRFQELMNTNADFKRAIDAYTNQKPEAVGLLSILSESGEPYAQLFLGLSYEKDWSNVYDLKVSCDWIRKSAEAGVSQARLLFAHRAMNKSPCFDVEPTLEEVDFWARLAGRSVDATVKAEAKSIEEANFNKRYGLK